MDIQWRQIIGTSVMTAICAYTVVSYFRAPPLVSPDELRADLRSIGHPAKASPLGLESEIHKAPFLISLSQGYRTDDPLSESDLLRFYKAAFESNGWKVIDASGGRFNQYEFCKNRVLGGIEIENNMTRQSYTIFFESGQLATKCPRERENKETEVVTGGRP
jgi:hypothetical protein